MRRTTLTLAAITGCLASSLLALKLQGAAPVAAPPAHQATTSPRIGAQYGKLPMAFEPNQGQTAREVRFLARGPGYDLLLTPTAAVLTLHQPPRVRSPATPSQAPRRHPAGRAEAAAREPPLTLQLKLLGANPQALISGEEALPGKVNYLHGKDPKGWRTNIPTYRQVKYAEVYPGIDLLYYGNPHQLENDFVVAPGADPGAIALALAGPGKLALDASGDLVLRHARGELRFARPVIYQEVAGKRRAITGGYVLTGAGRVGFQVGAYDTRLPLVIDPVLVYSTYLGGGFDAFVAKLTPADDALVYATYLGGSGNDSGFGIALDSAGSAYVTGETSSRDFPVAGNPFQLVYGGSDAFVAKIDVGIAQDLNRDGVVNCTDLAIIRDSFGKRRGQAEFDPRADATHDGLVNLRDLSFVARAMPVGTRCP